MVVFSLFFGMYADDAKPEDRSSYDWAFIQRHRIPGIIAKKVGLPLGVAVLVLGLLLSVSDLVI